MTYLRAFLGTIVSFLAVDAVWISLVVRGLYEKEVGDLLSESPRMLPAAVFYLAYAAGIVWLAVRPALAERSLAIALVNGGMVGAIGYGTYTITNYSVFERWTFGLVWTDIAWGVFLTALSAGCGYLASRNA